MQVHCQGQRTLYAIVILGLHNNREVWYIIAQYLYNEFSALIAANDCIKHFIITYLSTALSGSKKTDIFFK